MVVGGVDIVAVGGDGGVGDVAVVVVEQQYG